MFCTDLYKDQQLHTVIINWEVKVNLLLIKVVGDVNNQKDKEVTQSPLDCLQS